MPHPPPGTGCQTSSTKQKNCFFSVAAEITFVFNSVILFPDPHPFPLTPIPFPMSSSTYHPPTHFPIFHLLRQAQRACGFLHGARLHSSSGHWQWPNFQAASNMDTAASAGRPVLPFPTQTLQCSVCKAIMRPWVIPQIGELTHTIWPLICLLLLIYNTVKKKLKMLKDLCIFFSFSQLCL